MPDADPDVAWYFMMPDDDAMVLYYYWSCPDLTMPLIWLLMLIIDIPVFDTWFIIPVDFAWSIFVCWFFRSDAWYLCSFIISMPIFVFWWPLFYWLLLPFIIHSLTLIIHYLSIIDIHYCLIIFWLFWLFFIIFAMFIPFIFIIVSRHPDVSTMFCAMFMIRCRSILPDIHASIPRDFDVLFWSTFIRWYFWCSLLIRYSMFFAVLFAWCLLMFWLYDLFDAPTTMMFWSCFDADVCCFDPMFCSDMFADVRFVAMILFCFDMLICYYFWFLMIFTRYLISTLMMPALILFWSVCFMTIISMMFFFFFWFYFRLYYRLYYYFFDPRLLLSIWLYHFILACLFIISIFDDPRYFAILFYSMTIFRYSIFDLLFIIHYYSLIHSFPDIRLIILILLIIRCPFFLSPALSISDDAWLFSPDDYFADISIVHDWSVLTICPRFDLFFFFCLIWYAHALICLAHAVYDVLFVLPDYYLIHYFWCFHACLLLILLLMPDIWCSVRYHVWCYYSIFIILFHYYLLFWYYFDPLLSFISLLFISYYYYYSIPAHVLMPIFWYFILLPLFCFMFIWCSIWWSWLYLPTMFWSDVLDVRCSVRDEMFAKMPDYYLLAWYSIISLMSLPDVFFYFFIARSLFRWCPRLFCLHVAHLMFRCSMFCLFFIIFRLFWSCLMSLLPYFVPVLLFDIIISMFWCFDCRYDPFMLMMLIW